MKKLLSIIGLVLCLMLSPGCVRTGLGLIDDMYYDPEDVVKAGDGWSLEWSEKTDTFTSKSGYYEINDNYKLAEDPSFVIIVEMLNCTKTKDPHYTILSGIQLPDVVLYTEDTGNHEYKLHLTKIGANMYSINNNDFEAEMVSDGNGIFIAFRDNDGIMRNFHGKFCTPDTVLKFAEENRVCHRDSSVKDVLDGFFATTNKALKRTY